MSFSLAQRVKAGGSRIVILTIGTAVAKQAAMANIAEELWRMAMRSYCYFLAVVFWVTVMPGKSSICPIFTH